MCSSSACKEDDKTCSFQLHDKPEWVRLRDVELPGYCVDEQSQLLKSCNANRGFVLEVNIFSFSPPDGTTSLKVLHVWKTSTSHALKHLQGSRTPPRKTRGDYTTVTTFALSSHVNFMLPSTQLYDHDCKLVKSPAIWPNISVLVLYFRMSNLPCPPCQAKFLFGHA